MPARLLDLIGRGLDRASEPGTHQVLKPGPALAAYLGQPIR